MTTTTITDNTSIARRHKDSNKRGPSTCDRACAVIQSRLAGTTAVHVARTEAPSRTRLATSGSSTRHSNRRVTIQASARGNARPPQSQYPRATRERAAWRRCRTRSMAVNDSMSPTGTLSTHTDLAVSERDARPSQSQHSGRSCTQGRGGARRQEGLPPWMPASELWNRGPPQRPSPCQHAPANRACGRNPTILEWAGTHHTSTF